jgi:hypothetical protein
MMSKQNQTNEGKEATPEKLPTTREQRFIADLAAFIRFGFRTHKTAGWTLANIAHDLDGALQYGLDSHFSPRVTGYAEAEKHTGKDDITLSEGLDFLRSVGIEVHVIDEHTQFGGKSTV